MLALGARTQHPAYAGSAVHAALLATTQSLRVSASDVSRVIQELVHWYPEVLGLTTLHHPLLPDAPVDVPRVSQCPHCQCGLRPLPWKQTRALTLRGGVLPITWQRASCDVCRRFFSNSWKYDAGIYGEAALVEKPGGDYFQILGKVEENSIAFVGHAVLDWMTT